MHDYQGYLLKINGTILDNKYITAYDSVPNGQTDLDTYTDGQGVTHRNILPHTKTTISFTTPPLYLEDKIALTSLFPRRTKVNLEYWNDETNDYRKGEFYIPDISYEILTASSDTIAYRPIRYEFIEY